MLAPVPHKSQMSAPKHPLAGWTFALLRGGCAVFRIFSTTYS